MKEVTYEDWQKNSTHREMWVWDDGYEEDKKKLKVLYISKEAYPVVSVTSDDKHVYRYEHCAEIEKQRRMTSQELAWWLREKPTREWKWTFDSCIYSVYVYGEQYVDEEVSVDVRIREDDGEWREPLVEE